MFVIDQAECPLESDCLMALYLESLMCSVCGCPAKLIDVRKGKVCDGKINIYDDFIYCIYKLDLPNQFVPWNFFLNHGLVGRMKKIAS